MCHETVTGGVPHLSYAGISNATPLRRIAICLAGATLSPFCILAIELYVAHRFEGFFDDWCHYPALILELLVGGAFMYALPFRLWIRILLLLVYVPAFGHVLFVAPLLVAGYVFGNWL